MFIRLFSFFLLIPLAASAIEQDIVINTEDVRFSKDPFFAEDSIKIYVTAHNGGESDIEGFITCLDNGNEIAIAPLSLRKSGVKEEIWCPWTPTEGEHVILIIAFLRSGQDPDQKNSTVRITRFVDRDSDKDGIGDRDDTDKDNDGIPDTFEETHGLNPRDSSDALRDVDGDGVTNFDEFKKGSDPQKSDAIVREIPKSVSGFVAASPPPAAVPHAVSPPVPPSDHPDLKDDEKIESTQLFEDIASSSQITAPQKTAGRRGFKIPSFPVPFDKIILYVAGSLVLLSGFLFWWGRTSESPKEDDFNDDEPV